MQLQSVDSTTRSATRRIGRVGLCAALALGVGLPALLRPHAPSAAEVTGDAHARSVEAAPRAEVPDAPAAEPPSEIRFHGGPARELDADPASAAEETEQEIRFHGDPTRELDPEVFPPDAETDAQILERITPERIDQDLLEIRLLVERAHYRTALAIAAATREVLDAKESTADFEVRRARLEVLSATSEIALGREERAVTHMRAALRADPDLELDPAATSPKGRGLLERARAGSPSNATVSVAP